MAKERRISFEDEKIVSQLLAKNIVTKFRSLLVKTV